MKRLLPILLAGLLLCPPLPAAAWDAQTVIAEAELPPEAQPALESGAYVTALWESPTLFLLTQAADGTRTLTVLAHGQTDFSVVTASAPLPAMNGIQPTVIAYAGSVSILYSEALQYYFAPDFQGVWRLAGVQGTHDYRCGAYWIREVSAQSARLFTAADPAPELAVFAPADFPPDFTAAAQRQITDRYALVNNPNPADRLHLRTEPDQASASLGKYYNGTPVRILETVGAWARVSVAGVDGYMMTDYLAAGAAMLGVTPTFPDLFISPSFYGADLNVYRQPAESGAVAGVLTDRGAGRVQVTVIGLAGDGWVHVICGNGLAGYMPASQFYPGNG